MDFIEQVGTRYLEGKVNAAPQQIENLAKKQFFTSHKDDSKAKSRKGNTSPTGDHDEHGEHGEYGDYEDYEEHGRQDDHGDSDEHEYEDSHDDHKQSRARKVSKGRSEHNGVSEKDLEIARLRGELEESRREARIGASSPAVSKNKKSQHKAADKKESPTRKLRRSRSTKAFEDKGIKIVGGALVADAASRRHREKRPEHGATKELGKTIDGKGFGLATGALVAERGNKARSKSQHAAKEPIIVEAAPRRDRKRRPSHEEEYAVQDEGSEHGSMAYSTLSRRRSRPEDEYEADRRSVAHSTIPRRNRRQSLDEARSEYGSIIAPPRASHSRRSFAEESNHGSVAPSHAPGRRDSHVSRSEISSIHDFPLSRHKSALASRGRRPSTESAIGSVIAPPAQVEAIRRRQRSRGRGLTDVDIDTPAPETPSLRTLSRRRREAETRHERGHGRGEEEDAAHLPERHKSLLHERAGGEGSVIDILEAKSVPFRPHREVRGGGYRGSRRAEEDWYEEKQRAWERERQREMDIVEVLEERQRGPVVRRIDMGERAVERSEVELMRKEGGRSVYRVR